MSWTACSLVESALRRTQDVVSSNFLEAQPSWIAEAGFTLILVNLKDALLALNGLGRRVSFIDDVQISGDVTDLVREMRNAACHNGSISRMFDKENSNSLHFGLCFGAGVLLKSGDLELSNPYQDDVAVFYGSLRILLRRHVYRALDEAKQNLALVAPEYDYRIYR